MKFSEYFCLQEGVDRKVIKFVLIERAISLEYEQKQEDKRAKNISFVIKSYTNKY
jgi:hypothetical protein